MQNEIPDGIYIPKRQRIINIILDFFDRSVVTDLGIYFIIKAILPDYVIMQWLVLLATARELFDWVSLAKYYWERDYFYPMPPPTQYPFDIDDEKKDTI